MLWEMWESVHKCQKQQWIASDGQGVATDKITYSSTDIDEATAQEWAALYSVFVCQKVGNSCMSYTKSIQLESLQLKLWTS